MRVGDLGHGRDARRGTGRVGSTLTAAWLLGALMATAGCDSDAAGTLLVTVEAPVALGAVVLEVVGSGVQGFEGVGDTQVYGGVVSVQQGRHRVVLVDPVGGVLRFGVLVRDVRATPPSMRVVSVSGTDDVERSTSDIDVRIAFAR